MSMAKDLYKALQKVDGDECLEILSNDSIKDTINDIVQSKRKWTCLAEACVLGDEEIVEEMLLKHANCNQKTMGGKTPLMIAADNGHNKVVETLITLGNNCKVAEQDDAGKTALHYAAGKGHVKTVQRLLKAKVERDIPNEEGETALHLALQGKCITCAEMLVEYGFDVNVTTCDGKTALHAAAMGCVPEGVELAIGSDVNAVDNQGNTALHILLKDAQERDSVLQCCKLLVELSVDTSLKNNYNKSAIDYAHLQKMDHIAALLQGAKAKPLPQGSATAELGEQVRELAHGQRRHSHTLEKVADQVSEHSKGLKNVENKVQAVTDTTNEQVSQIAQLETAMENLKADLDRENVRPRTGNTRSRQSKVNPVAQCDTADSKKEEKDLALRIQKLFPELRDHIQTELGDHLDFLLAKGVISPNRYHSIRYKSDEQEKARDLIFNIMSNITKDNFQWFVESLKQHESTKRLAELLSDS